MNVLRTIVSLFACALTFAVVLVGQVIPIPIVRRDTRQPSTVFTRPDLVVLASILEKRITEEVDIDGASFTPPRTHRQVVARLRGVLRVNERLQFHPDLNDRQFMLKMDNTRLELAFGKTYILMVNFVPEAPGVAWVSKSSPPTYVLSLKDGGFEDDGTRVHVLQRGGELSAYDGKASTEVYAAIERGR